MRPYPMIRRLQIVYANELHQVALNGTTVDYVDHPHSLGEAQESDRLAGAVNFRF